MSWLLLAASCATATALPPGAELAGSSTASVQQDGRSITYELRRLHLTGSEVLVVYEPETRLAWWISHHPEITVHFPDRLNTTSTGIGVSRQRLVVFSVGGPTRLFADESTARFSSATEARNEIARFRLRTQQPHAERAVAEIELRDKLDSSFSYASDGSQRLMTIAAVGRQDGHWLVTLHGPNGDRADVTLTDDYKLIDVRRYRLATLLGFQITGRVTIADSPLPGATVRLGKTVRISDAEGRFTFKNVKSGAHTIISEFAGALTLSREIAVGAEDVQIELPMKLAPVAEAITITCILPKFAHGIVYDEHGELISGAEVEIAGDDGSTFAADPNGEFFITFHDLGAFRFIVRKPGYEDAELSGMLPDKGIDMRFALCRR